jgi:hypothetical protein
MGSSRQPSSSAPLIGGNNYGSSSDVDTSSDEVPLLLRGGDAAPSSLKRLGAGFLKTRVHG